MGYAFIVNCSHLLGFARRQDSRRDLEKAEVPADSGVFIEGNTNLQDQRDKDEGHEDKAHVRNGSSGAQQSRGPAMRRYATWSTMRSTFSTQSATLTRLFTWVSPKPTWLHRIKSFFFPPDEPPTEIDKFAPNYRWSPIVSGIIIPLCILLEIPGLTEDWYIKTNTNQTVSKKPNPPILIVGMTISMACAILANVCLILRFSEKWIKATTLFCIFFLTVHDGINIAAVTTFGVVHRFDDGFTYGQSFWMTLCSTIASTITNVNLISDYIRTPHFAYSGSGLTRKQRSLVILVIILLMYIALGALINSELLSLNYIDGLYFTVVSIETIGFGDIRPTNTGSRVFMCCYIALGMIILGIVISVCRDTVLEGLEIGYRKRHRNMRARRREARRFRRWETRWRNAVEWRLRENNLPVWVSDSEYHQDEDSVRFVGLGGLDNWGWTARLKNLFGVPPSPLEDPQDRPATHVEGHPCGKHLNINALSNEELQSAALEAGVPLNMFVDFSAARRFKEGISMDQPRPQGATLNGTCWPAEVSTPTDAQIGRMAATLTKVALALSGHELHVPDGATQEHSRMAGATIEMHAEEDEVLQEYRGRDPAQARTASKIASQADKVARGDSVLRHTNPPRWIRKIAYETKENGLTPYSKFKKDMEDEEKNATIVKLTIAWSVFLIFWFVGSAIFSTTEGWSYGIAMYFCFISFTTTGYGDFSPQTPAGRSIFVVWALFGVGTLTILAAVIEDTGSSRYQDAMHSRAFEKAVAEYRRKTAHTAAQVPEAEYQLQRTHQYAQEDMGKQTRDVSPDDTHPDVVQNTAERLQKAHESALERLEKLPAEVINQARIFYDYMQYIVRGSSHSAGGLPGEGKQTNVPRDLKRLLDEIVEAQNVGDRVKYEILQDQNAKNTLFMLSIERALKNMIQSAESALSAISERDRLRALQEGQLSRLNELSSPNDDSKIKDYVDHMPGGRPAGVRTPPRTLSLDSSPSPSPPSSISRGSGYSRSVSNVRIGRSLSPTPRSSRSRSILSRHLQH